MRAHITAVVEGAPRPEAALALDPNNAAAAAGMPPLTAEAFNASYAGPVADAIDRVLDGTLDSISGGWVDVAALPAAASRRRMQQASPPEAVTVLAEVHTRQAELARVQPAFAAAVSDGTFQRYLQGASLSYVDGTGAVRGCAPAARALACTARLFPNQH